MPRRGKISSLDIAHLAGVSQPTVSRALRGSPLVSEETRRRIEAIARELNYKPDKNASNLRRQHSGTLAVLLFEEPGADESAINPFFLAMLGSIMRASARRGYDLLLSFQQLSNDWQADYEDCKKADGLILLGYGDYEESRPRFEQLVRQGTHFVRWGAALPDHPGVSIGCDNRQGGNAATRHLIERGRRHVAFLGDASDHYPEFAERYRGHVDALQAAGLAVHPALQVDATSSEESGHAAALALLARGAPFDAVFAASDLIAVGAMHAFAEHGLEVPRDVAVVGFDDIPMARFARPALSTVQQNTAEAGAVLVDTLLRLVAEESADSRMLPTRLVVRRSCGEALATRRAGPVAVA